VGRCVDQRTVEVEHDDRASHGQSWAKFMQVAGDSGCGASRQAGWGKPAESFGQASPAGPGISWLAARHEKPAMAAGRWRESAPWIDM
ncbi:hypothetical protein, partial [Mesorhizobium sp. P5_C1]